MPLTHVNCKTFELLDKDQRLWAETQSEKLMRHLNLKSR